MSSEDNSRIDRREARRAMGDKIFCILFPCFSPPDDSPLCEELPSENQPVSQRPSTSAGGDLPSEDLPVSQRPFTSEDGDSPSEDQPVSQQPSTSECGDLPSEVLPVSQRPTTSEGGDLACEDHLVSQRPSTSERGGLPSENHPVSASKETEKKIIDYITQRSNAGDLDGFIEILSRFDRIAKGKSLCQEPEQTYRACFTWLNNSGGLKKLGEILSKLIEWASALKECFQSGPVLSLIEKIGKANVATAGLLAVAYVLETVEQISENNEECLRLLKEIYFLAQLVKQHKDSQIEVQTLIDRATELVVQEAITLVKQIESDGFCKWWSASINEGNLRKTERQITSMYQNINAHMGIRLLNAVERNNQPRLSRGYPEHAVGMEDAFREVMGLIEWGSPKKAIGVILYGFGGMGKTTLADAVFSRVDLDGCRYSMVEFCENMDLTKIVELQKDILKDLMGTKNIPEFRKHEEGRRLLSRKLEEVPALIYIDNVLDKDNLRQLLPLKLDKAKKVRLLITARDRNVRKACPMETPPREYRMTGISSAASKSLLDKQLHDAAQSRLANGMTNDMEGNSDSNIDHIIQKCGGIPLLLTLVAHELSCAKDTLEVRQVIEELEKLEGEEFGEKLESYFFVYDKLPQQCQEPFLDICSSFEGWDWDTVADILGNSALDKLERRALVTKGANGAVTVHEVILKIGRRKAKGMRFRFTTTSELQKDDQKVKREIQGKMAWLLCNGKDPGTHRERSKTLGENIKKALKNAKMKDVYFICVPAFDEKKKEEIPVTDSMKMAYFPTQDSEMPQEKGKLGLEHALYLSRWASVRFWARVHDFREHIERMDEKAKQGDGMRKLLKSLKFGVLSMALMDEKGEMVTTEGREIMDIFDKNKGTWTGLTAPQKKRAKELVGDLMKGPEEKRKDALDELKQYWQHRQKQDLLPAEHFDLKSG